MITPFLNHLIHGDFGAAWEDFSKSFKKLPKPVQDFITGLATDEGKLLMALAEEAAKDVAAGGFTTEAFMSAGKDVVAKALAQGKTIAISDAIAHVNIFAKALQPAPAAPAEPSPAA